MGGFSDGGAIGWNLLFFNVMSGVIKFHLDKLRKLPPSRQKSIWTQSFSSLLTTGYTLPQSVAICQFGLYPTAACMELTTRL